MFRQGAGLAEIRWSDLVGQIRASKLACNDRLVAGRVQERAAILSPLPMQTCAITGNGCWQSRCNQAQSEVHPSALGTAWPACFSVPHLLVHARSTRSREHASTHLLEENLVLLRWERLGRAKPRLEQLLQVGMRGHKTRHKRRMTLCHAVRVGSACATSARIAAVHVAATH